MEIFQTCTGVFRQKALRALADSKRAQFIIYYLSLFSCLSAAIYRKYSSSVILGIFAFFGFDERPIRPSADGIYKQYVPVRASLYLKQQAENIVFPVVYDFRYDTAQLTTKFHGHSVALARKRVPYQRP